MLTDQLGTIPSHPLPSRHIRASYISRESLPRAAECCRDHKRLFWTSQSDGKMRPTSWQVHGLLLIVPRRRGTERCECFYRHYKNQEDDTVRGLVPDWIQGILEYDLKSWEGLGDCNHIKENKKKKNTNNNIWRHGFLTLASQPCNVCYCFLRTGFESL